MKRRLLSIVLTLAMVLSLLPAAAFATETENSSDLDVNGDGKITYVSLGESMTNGYGMEGYYTYPADFVEGTFQTPEYLSHGDGNGNHFGYGRKEPATYAASFAEYLEQYGEVEWLPMAISGQRPEDFYWFLQEGWNKADDAGSDYLAGLFNEDGSYNGDMYTTEIWKNGNCNQGKSSRYLDAKYGGDMTYALYNQAVKDTRIPDGIGAEGIYSLYWDAEECKTVMVHRDELTPVKSSGIPAATIEKDGKTLTLISNGWWADITPAAQQDDLAAFRADYMEKISGADVITVNL